MDIENKAEFILGILEREAERATKEWANLELTLTEPIVFPNSSELLAALNLALEDLELEEAYRREEKE